MGAAFIKRRAAAVTKVWDDVPLTTMIKEVITRVHQEDSVEGKWCVNGPSLG